MKLFSKTILVVSSVLISISPAFAFRTSKSIREEIGDKIDQVSVGKYDIIVDAAQGKVTLTGTVSSNEDKSAIEDLARNTEGVDLVNNKLVIVETEQTTRARLNPEAIVSDESITEKVKKEISVLKIKGSKHILVTTNNGVVNFKGSLANHRQIDHILAVSLMVPGVKDIQNEITIGKKVY